MCIFSGLFSWDEVVLGLKLCGAADGLSYLRVNALGSRAFARGWTHKLCKACQRFDFSSITAKTCLLRCAEETQAAHSAVLLMEPIPAQPCCRHASTPLLGPQEVGMGWP